MSAVTRIAALEAKRKARGGKPGMVANVEAIEREMARLEPYTGTYRGKATHRFVSPAFALDNPDTTERVR